MRRLVLELGPTSQLHAVGCVRLHPCTGLNAVEPTADEVLAAPLAVCCAPSLDEWRLTSILASENRIFMGSRAGSTDPSTPKTSLFSSAAAPYGDPV